MRKQNGVSTVKMQISMDETTHAILVGLVPIGLRGKNKSEVAYGIIREWIWANQENIRKSGVPVGPQQK